MVQVSESHNIGFSQLNNNKFFLIIVEHDNSQYYSILHPQ